MTIKETLLAGERPNEPCATDNIAPLMSWSSRAINHPPQVRQGAILACLVMPFLLSLNALWSHWKGAQEEHEINQWLVFSALFIALLMIAMCRQKTVFNYQIFASHGELEFYEYYPSYTGHLFKGIVIFIILAVMGVALYTDSWVILILAPITILMGTGGALLSWRPPLPKHRKTNPWLTHESVTIDRKYRIIVIHCDDPTTGFVARFPDKALFDQYLAFLKSVLPPDVQYREEVWTW